MGSYRREYEDYYSGLKSGGELGDLDKNNTKINPKFVKHRNDLAISRGVNYYKGTKEREENSIVKVIYYDILGAMIIFLIFLSFIGLKGFGRDGLYKEAKVMIEKNYTVDELKGFVNLDWVLEKIKEIKIK
ncbi:hypothetical protein [Clostridium chrysemydis]|uniref:hypothetical protein n=1 Tax=Clostridium chrysemydis TaxID=2665504 RepID=UPI001883A6B1|nr:hypothetical protein [Clostridium chrysemydis]